jgi:hypothetical protein
LISDSTGSGPDGLICDSAATPRTDCYDQCANYDQVPIHQGSIATEWETMMKCIADNLTSLDDYLCSGPGLWTYWYPIGGTTCETSVCTWICDDYDTLGNYDGAQAVYDRCCT